MGNLQGLHVPSKKKKAPWWPTQHCSIASSLVRTFCSRTLRLAEHFVPKSHTGGIVDCTCGNNVTRNAPAEEERKTPLSKRLASHCTEVLLLHLLRVSAARDWDQDMAWNRFRDRTENYSELTGRSLGALSTYIAPNLTTSEMQCKKNAGDLHFSDFHV